MTSNQELIAESDVDGLESEAGVQADEGSDEAAAGDGPAEIGSAPKTVRQRVFATCRRWWVILLTLLAIVAVAGAVWQYLTQYRSDTGTDSRVAESVVVAAREGTVAILSYSPDTLDRDFAAARTHLSGNFLDYFNEFTEQVVTPAATEKKVKTAAEVTRAAVTELHPSVAKVLVYINQTTTSSDKPDPALTSSSVLVTLERHGNAWLISGFDPV